MAYVVIRRFRSGDGPTSARVFGDVQDAREMAETWYQQGWEVELVPPGQRGTPRKLPGSPQPLPPHPSV